MTRLLPTALACACLSLSPALADVAVSAAHPSVELPWGDWITAVLQPVSAILVPIAAAAVTAGIAKVAPMASLVLTKSRVEDAIQHGADAGINSVAGAVKGKTIEIPLGSPVIVAGVQHVLDLAPTKIITAAGGAAGIAGRIFRALPLEQNASIENVLKPALSELTARGLIK